MSFFTITASAPMTVLAGSVVATYAVTGVKGVPLSFVVLMIALLPFTAGYTAMSRYVSHAGPFYAYMARGLSRTMGVAGGLLALLAYNSIQICLYGLLGVSLQGFLPSAGLSWWAWALIAWALIAIFGLLHIQLNAKVLAVTLGLEVFMVLLFDLAGFSNPAGGHIQLAGLAPGSLFTTGIGGVFAFGIAAFVGYETGMAYAEEARGTRPVVRATFIAVIFLGCLYALSSLALSVAEGPGGVIDASRATPVAIPFSIISSSYGSPVATFANLLLITSILGAMLSFHNTTARYAFALARERVLPASIGAIGRGSTAGSPIGGSILQSSIALVTFGAFAVTGANPVTTLFTWGSAVAALSIVLLMVCTSLAVLGFFRREVDAARVETYWRRSGGPALGAILLGAVLVITTYNIQSLLGTDSVLLTIAIPGIVVITAVIGVIWGATLRSTNPAVYRFIGVGEQQPLDKPTPAFENIEL